MIGVSLPYTWLLTGEDASGLPLDRTLDELRLRGVGSVELRTVLAAHSPEDVLSVCNMLWARGFQVTVHSRMHSAASAVSDIFGPLRLVLDNLKQDKLILVLHPIAADNVAILNSLADHIVERGYPVTVALENNRLMPDGTEGDSVAHTLETVKAVNRPEVAVCFDMGHYMYYLGKHHAGEPLTMPPREFLRRTVHTHIHALDGLKTHYPLTAEYDLPLKTLIAAIKWGYFGVYNFEPDLPRWQGRIDPLPAILASVDTLRESMPHCAGIYDRIRAEFDTRFNRALGVYSKFAGGIEIALANSTFYLFNTNGYKWAMDPAFRYARHLAKTPGRVAELLSDVKLIVITHGHVDHFEEETVRALAACDMLWVIPDFLYGEAIDYGIRPEKIIVAHENQPICIEKLTILPFEGRHLRPITKQGVPEYGYYITAKDASSMVFPADVRDYDPKGLPDIPQADVCFLHLWFGDGNSFDPEHTEKAEEIARYMLSLSDKHIVIAHLYESGRRDEDMWRLEHAEELSAVIRKISPKTRITVPNPGDVFTP